MLAVLAVVALSLYQTRQHKQCMQARNLYELGFEHTKCCGFDGGFDVAEEGGLLRAMTVVVQHLLLGSATPALTTAMCCGREQPLRDQRQS